MASLYTRPTDAFLSVKQHLMAERTGSYHRSSSFDRRLGPRRNFDEDSVSEFELEDKQYGEWNSDCDDFEDS